MFMYKGTYYEITVFLTWGWSKFQVFSRFLGSLGLACTMLLFLMNILLEHTHLQIAVLKRFFFQISKISYAYGWVLLYNVSLGTTSLNNVFVIESTSWHFVMRLSSVTIEWWYLQVILAMSIQQLHNTWRATFPLIHIFSSGK